MIIIAEVIKENSDEFEIRVVEVDAPFVITKVKDKLYIYKGGNCILTKALSLEIFESGVCIKKINWYDEMKEVKRNEEL